MYLLVTSIFGLKQQSHQSPSKKWEILGVRCCDDLNVVKKNS
jgi:hypothetical protein